MLTVFAPKSQEKEKKQTNVPRTASMAFVNERGTQDESTVYGIGKTLALSLSSLRPTQPEQDWP